MSDNNGKRSSGGRPKALSSREEQTVLRLASTGKYSGMEIIKETGLNNYRKTICNTVKRTGDLHYVSKLIKLPLLLLHKMQRLSFAWEIMT